jgi:hypothetical protein
LFLNFLFEEMGFKLKDLNILKWNLN